MYILTLPFLSSIETNFFHFSQDLGFINSQLLLMKFPAVMTKRIESKDLKFPLQYTLNEKSDATPDVDLRRSQWTQLPLTISVSLEIWL